MNEALPYMPVLGKHSNPFFSNTIDLSLLRTQFYGKWAKSTWAAHQGNRRPNKIVIFRGIFQEYGQSEYCPQCRVSTTFYSYLQYFPSLLLSLKGISLQPSKRYGGKFNTGEMNQS